MESPQYVSYQKRIPVETGWDLVVAGAGPAGASAALTAARKGLNVLLLEVDNRVGGMGTSGMISAFAPMSDGERCVAGGIAQELMEALYERGATGPQVTPAWWERSVQLWIPFQPEKLTLIWDELLEEAGVTVRFGSRVVDAELAEDGKTLTGVVVADVEGLSLVRADYFVDGTGDASLAVAAGYPAWRAGRDTDHIMAPTLCALYAGIDWESMDLEEHGTYPRRQQALLEQALADGWFQHSDRHFPGIYRIGRGLGMVNAGHIFDTDAVDKDSLSRAYIEGRKLVREYHGFFRAYVAGCEDMELVYTASLLGVRESRRIRGEYVLCYEDFATRRRFEDGIGLSAGSVDIHPYDESPEEYQRHIEEFAVRDKLGLGETVGLPYRSLLPRDSRNLWVAGRCVSSDVKVQGAIRIQPVAAVLGQAAGTAAWLARENKASAQDVDVATLRKMLRKDGAVLD